VNVVQLEQEGGASRVKYQPSGLTILRKTRLMGQEPNFSLVLFYKYCGSTSQVNIGTAKSERSPSGEGR
jgi:hypothetical protein